MRILLTTDTIGGVWTFTKELTTGLLERGHYIALVSFGRQPSPDQARWCETMRRAYSSAFRYDNSPAPLEWMPGNGSAYSDAEPLLFQIAAEFSPEILHTSQFCFGALPLSIPKVITAHSDVLSWAAACRPEGLDPSPWLARYCALVQEGLDGANAVVAPTRWMMDTLSQHFHIPDETHVIPNGRGLAVVAESENRLLQAVSAGRLWDEAKNLSLLSEFHSPLPVVIAGDPHQEATAAANIPTDVTFAGKLAEDDLVALFRASSIYLATSIYEPFGLAPLEAALCGCCVVANDIPSLREVWEDAALYFHTADELRRVLTALAESPRTLHGLQQRSFQRAMQFTRSRMVDAYLDLYRQLLIQQQTPAYEPAAYA